VTTHDWLLTQGAIEQSSEAISHPIPNFILESLNLFNQSSNIEGG
jgi:hypothetical protein